MNNYNFDWLTPEWQKRTEEAIREYQKEEERVRKNIEKYDLIN